ncbi:MAG TPA: hypothetical protein VGR28_12425 [Candidatus Thermoplasmatota archaeon]|jgi:hypothetical protein|nr:hypothetical protein [Candidatus Thermoplasmatota archaeon]
MKFTLVVGISVAAALLAAGSSVAVIEAVEAAAGVASSGAEEAIAYGIATKSEAEARATTAAYELQQGNVSSAVAQVVLLAAPAGEAASYAEDAAGDAFLAAYDAFMAYYGATDGTGSCAFGYDLGAPGVFVSCEADPGSLVAL